ncbi:MAG: 3-deoxy-D-manno-octulosonic acid transferase [Flavobacteriales bacterium]|nr:3-deoxy-D-manno-octulosonic acid transferase [Flavobacteriales bacterium]
MSFLYHILIQLYAFAVTIFSLFNYKAKLWVIGRKNLLQKIKSTVKPTDEIVWFHCASLGEYEQAKPVIEKIKNQYNTYKILVTFFSPSGYEIRKNDSLVDYIFYLPIDTKSNAVQFIKITRPKIVFFVKYEFWYNYICQLKQNNIPTYLISGVFRENQLFFKWYGKWYKKVLSGFTHFFVQNKHSEQLLISSGFTNVTLSGDTRFDRVYENSKNPKQLPLIEKFKDNKNLLIGGSTWKSEEEILAEYIKSNPGQKLIIAPHTIDEKHLREIELLFQQKTLRYSLANEMNINTTNILIIDCIGLLSIVYQYTDIALIGGGFSGALHNILEPASFGNAVIFGSNHQKFHEAQELISAGGGFSVNSAADFKNILEIILSNLNQNKQNSKAFILKNTGATDLILDYLV